MGHAPRRFTPARAGRMNEKPERLSRYSTVHPRACGADRTTSIMALSFVGSPPRVRGGFARRPGRCRCRRFTPARAGRMGRSPSPTGENAVHPRACGADGRSWPGLARGSRFTPARAGRMLRSNGEVGLRLRFTPARAGRMRSAATLACSSAVHPRACGADNLGRNVGSFSIRFTPARAGRMTNRGDHATV